MRALVFTLGLLLALAAPAQAAQPKLSKREAQARALQFVSPFVDMLDTERKVGAEMVPPAACARISPSTIRCPFKATLYTGDVIRSHVTVHRQRDGLLGFRTGLDVLRDGI